MSQDFTYLYLYKSEHTLQKMNTLMVEHISMSDDDPWISENMRVQLRNSTKNEHSSKPNWSTSSAESSKTWYTDLKSKKWWVYVKKTK